MRFISWGLGITEEKQAYIEHNRLPEIFATGRNPLIPPDGLVFFGVSSDVSAEATLRLRSGKLPEWRFDAKNLVFDEARDENVEAPQGTKEKAAKTFTQDLGGGGGESQKWGRIYGLRWGKAIFQVVD